MKKRKVNDLEYCEYDFSKIKDSKGGFITTTTESQPKVLPEIIVGECEICTSIDIDINYLKYYNVQVCKQCKKLDKYTLLTKTEAKQDYILVDNEFKELKVWIRKNPRNDTYNNMLLYLKRDIEEFALKKWGSLEQMDQEFYNREEVKKERKVKVFEKNLKELRKKTRVSKLVVNKNQNCAHDFEVKDCVQICKICKIRVEFEEL